MKMDGIERVMSENDRKRKEKNTVLLARDRAQKGDK
jgi:hypothetical protein